MSGDDTRRGRETVSCGEFADLVVSDEREALERARAHADDCARCAALLRSHEMVLGEARRWKKTTPGPPATLEQRVLDAVHGERVPGRPSLDATRRSSDALPPARRPAPPLPLTWVMGGVIAAMLVVGAMLGVRATTLVPAPDRAERLLVAAALRDAEAAERAHARAIARLEEAVRPILARADDPGLPGNQAARLLSLRHRLEFLDQTIAEVQGFLDENPGHAGGRTMLLATYSEKTRVLRDVIALDQETGS